MRRIAEEAVEKGDDLVTASAAQVGIHLGPGHPLLHAGEGSDMEETADLLGQASFGEGQKKPQRRSRLTQDQPVMELAPFEIDDEGEGIGKVEPLRAEATPAAMAPGKPALDETGRQSSLPPRLGQDVADPLRRGKAEQLQAGLLEKVDDVLGPSVVEAHVDLPHVKGNGPSRLSAPGLATVETCRLGQPVVGPGQALPLDDRLQEGPALPGQILKGLPVGTVGTVAEKEPVGPIGQKEELGCSEEEFDPLLQGTPFEEGEITVARRRRRTGHGETGKAPPLQGQGEDLASP